MRFLFILIFFILNSSFSYASVITHAEAEDFVKQIEVTMNTRSPWKISEFFQYYMLPGAKVYKKSLIITEDVPINTDSIANIEYNRTQYIDSLKKIVSLPGKYKYSASLGNLEGTDNNTIMSVNIEESSVSGYEYETSGTEKNSVSTSCNFGIEKRGGYIVINSISCFEKIIVDSNV